MKGPDSDDDEFWPGQSIIFQHHAQALLSMHVQTKSPEDAVAAQMQRRRRAQPSDDDEFWPGRHCCAASWRGPQPFLRSGMYRFCSAHMCSLRPLLCSADAAEKKGPDSDDEEFWPGQGVQRSTSSVLQTRSGNAHGQSKGAKYRCDPLRRLLSQWRQLPDPVLTGA